MKCRYYPPISLINTRDCCSAGSHFSVWPEVDANDFCSKFVEKGVEDRQPLCQNCVWSAGGE